MFVSFVAYQGWKHLSYDRSRSLAVVSEPTSNQAFSLSLSNNYLLGSFDFAFWLR